VETQIQAIAHLAVSLYAFFLFSEGFRRRRQIESFYQISLINAGLGLWNFFLFLYYGLDTTDAVYTASQWGFVSVSMTIFSSFFFAWRISFGKRHDRFLYLFALIPGITSLLSVTSHFQNLFLAGHHGFVSMPLRELSIIRGPWFAVHSVSSYLFIVVSVILLAIQCFKPHRKNRKVMLLLVISILSFATVLFLSNFTSLKGAVQPYAFLSHLFTISVFYWATFLDEDDSVVYFGKQKFYDTIGMPVLMFNNASELVHANQDAERFFEEIDLTVKKYLSLKQLLDGNHVSRIDIGSKSDPDDPSFFVQNPSSGQILYCRQRDIPDGRNKRIGFSITLYNLQTADAFIQSLEKRAYTDTLCQCLNRTCFEQRKREILESAPRPLVLFIADLDNLKSVNDLYGHSAGDEYLSACAGVLKKAVRSSDTLFRIGGDEFAIFLSCPDEPGIQRVQKAVAAELSALRMPFPCSLSLGYSVIGEGDLDFNKHFKIADADMYRQKKMKKRA
jgi:diguanylate cyclase (GGDEF)-like protein